MKNLIVYFSLEGNTKFIAQAMEQEIQCDILELVPIKKYSTGRIGKYFWGGKSVFLKEKPKLINNRIDINSYKNLIIGTPVWCSTYTPPLNTFLLDNSIRYKNIALFACHGGGGADKCFEGLKKALPDNNFIGQISFKDPLNGDKEENSKKAVEWIKSIIK